MTSSPSLWLLARRIRYWLSLGMAPNPVFEELVREYLRERPSLLFIDWLRLHDSHVQALPDVARLLFDCLTVHFGIDAGKTRPMDRLEEDLHLSQLGWSDWDFEFRADFLRRFGIDLLDTTNAAVYCDVEGWLNHLCKLVRNR